MAEKITRSPGRDRYPHNYFLIEQLAARERRFQFAAQRSNAFILRKRSRNDFSRPLATPASRLAPSISMLSSPFLSLLAPPLRNAGRAAAQARRDLCRGTQSFCEPIKEEMRCYDFLNRHRRSCAFQKNICTRDFFLVSPLATPGHASSISANDLLPIARFARTRGLA